MYKTKKDNIAKFIAYLIVYGAIIGIIIIFFLFLSLWTDRTLDFWCTYLAHHVVNVPFWLSFVATVAGNGIIVALNIISEIVRLVI